MAISTLHSTIFRPLLLLGVISLVACGGGGGGKKSKDTTPEAFSFTASTNAATQAVVTSPAVTISGIDAPATVSITGGEYSINGGAFTAASGKVSSGQTIAVKVTASSVTNTPVDAVLSVGGIRATFRVTTAPDVTPGNFSFTPATNAALSTAVTSGAITLSGFDVAVPVSITNGEYSINGGAFTSAAGTISPAQTIAVKVVSSNANSTAVDATLTVGGVSATYSVTTLADAIPNAFTFTPTVNAAPGSTNTSNTVTVEGIEVAAPVAITGGEYSINGGAFTAAAGTVANGQTIAVKATAPAGTELTQSAVVTIGGVSGTYSVTTIPDTTAPVAEFKFPTPYTMSEASSVKVRGTATDEHAIANVTVVVNGTTEITVIPKAAGDFSSWTADVPLTANAENEIKVVATDDRNNSVVLNQANKVTIRQADIKNAFPNEIGLLNWPDNIVLDNLGGRNRLLVSSSVGNHVVAVDVSTGNQTVFVDYEVQCDSSLYALTLDPVGQRLYGICDDSSNTYKYSLLEFDVTDGHFIAEYPLPYELHWQSNIFGMALDRNAGRNRLVLIESTYENVEPEIGGSVFAFSLDNKTFSVISSSGQLPLIKGGRSIVVDGDHYLIPSGGQLEDANSHSVIAVNVMTGAHSTFSSNSVGAGDYFSGLLPNNETAGLYGSAIFFKKSRLFVNEIISGKLFSIDLATGERSVFKNLSYSQIGADNFVINSDLLIDENNDRAYVIDNFRNAILQVDLETSEKMILFKTKQ